MDFSLTEEQKMLKESVDRFLENYQTASDRAPCWAEFAELGWLAMPFSAEQGGYDGGIVESSLLMESFGKAGFREPYWASVLVAGRMLSAAPQSDLRDTLLEDLMAGTLTLGCALVEAGQSGLSGAESCRAERTDAGYVLRGEKVLVPNPDADYFLVVARTGDAASEQNLFVVKADAANMRCQRMTMMDGQDVVNIGFDDTPCEADGLFAEGEFAEVLPRVLDEAIVALAAEAQGAMDALLRDTVEYLKTRKQFGVAIGSFQALQHRVVDMYTDTELCRAMILRAQCAILDNSDDRASVIAGLKAMIGKKGRRLAEEAVQLHGGMGVSAELNVGDYLKRLMTIDACLGNAAQQQRRFCDLRYPSVS